MLTWQPLGISLAERCPELLVVLLSESIFSSQLVWLWVVGQPIMA